MKVRVLVQRPARFKTLPSDLLCHDGMSKKMNVKIHF